MGDDDAAVVPDAQTPLQEAVQAAQPASVTRTFGGPDARFYTETRFDSAETGDRVLVAEPGHDYVFASEDDVPWDGRWFPPGEGPAQPEAGERDYMHGLGQPAAKPLSLAPEVSTSTDVTTEPEG